MTHHPISGHPTPALEPDQGRLAAGEEREDDKELVMDHDELPEPLPPRAEAAQGTEAAERKSPPDA